MVNTIVQNVKNVLEHYIAEVAGSGQWKTFSVTDTRTGEVFIEKKFRKTAFDEIMSDKEYGPYIDALLEKAMVKVMADPESVDINVDSYEEIKSLAAELDETLFEE